MNPRTGPRDAPRAAETKVVERPLSDLKTFCEERAQEIRSVAQRLRFAHDRGSDIERPAGLDVKMANALQEVTGAVEELVDLLRRANLRGRPDTRLFHATLVAMWLSLSANADRREDSRTTGLRGHTGTLPISTVVEFLSSGKKSGVLEVRTASEIFAVEFENGDVVHAVSDSSPVGERLGDILVESGALEAAALDSVLKKYRYSPRTLGDALEQESLIASEGLRDALRTQMQMLFRRLFMANDANFEFHENDASKPKECVRMSAMQLLMESARLHDEGDRPVPGGAPALPAEPPPRATTAPDTSWHSIFEPTSEPEPQRPATGGEESEGTLLSTPDWFRLFGAQQPGTPPTGAGDADRGL